MKNNHDSVERLDDGEQSKLPVKDMRKLLRDAVRSRELKTSK